MMPDRGTIPLCYSPNLHRTDSTEAVDGDWEETPSSPSSTEAVDGDWEETPSPPSSPMKRVSFNSEVHTCVFEVWSRMRPYPHKSKKNKTFIHQNYGIW